MFDRLVDEVNFIVEFDNAQRPIGAKCTRAAFQTLNFKGWKAKSLVYLGTFVKELSVGILNWTPKIRAPSLRPDPESVLPGSLTPERPEGKFSLLERRATSVHWKFQLKK